MIFSLDIENSNCVYCTSVKKFFQRHMLANKVELVNRSYANSPLQRATTYKSFNSARIASSYAFRENIFLLLALILKELKMPGKSCACGNSTKDASYKTPCTKPSCPSTTTQTECKTNCNRKCECQRVLLQSLVLNRQHLTNFLTLLFQVIVRTVF